MNWRRVLLCGAAAFLISMGGGCAFHLHLHFGGAEPDAVIEAERPAPEAILEVKPDEQT